MHQIIDALCNAKDARFGKFGEPMKLNKVKKFPRAKIRKSEEYKTRILSRHKEGTPYGAKCC